MKKDNIFKRWWKLAQPNKKYLAGQIVFFCMYTILLSVITIFAAKTINCMYNKDWSGAFLNLGLELLTIILRNIAIHIEYFYYCKEYSYIRRNVTKKIYHKFLSCNNKEMLEVSKEKITNIALNNLSDMSDFPDSIASFVAYSFQVIFTLVAVFTANLLAGVIITCLGLLNFFAYYKFNRKLGKIMLERYEKKDDMFKTYSKVIDGKTVINELRSGKKYENELMHNVNQFTDAYTRYNMTHSWKVNIYFVFWNTIVYGIAALMLFFVSKGSLEISIYLIIVPYLTTCTEKLNTLFDKTSNIEKMRVDVDRVNLILSLNDEELIKYGDLNKETDDYKLGLIDVNKKSDENQKHSLKNVNITFLSGKVNVVRGEKESGKRTIFDLIRRYSKPDSGKVLLDNLDLYDYNEKTFKSHINYCASHPQFIPGTIKENLSLTCKNMKEIKKLCGEIGILNEIESLPKGFNTSITEVNSSIIIFMIGLARALLSNCKILMIYELPQDSPNEFRKNIIKLISKYNIDKTLIFFTHTSEYDSIADAIYNVSEGRVNKIK